MAAFRTMLFVPAQRDHMVEKAGSHGADAVVLDLEEAVPPAEKQAARDVVASRLEGLAAATGAPVYVRVNDVRSGLTRDDLMAVVRAGLAGVLLPKAEAAQDLRDLDVLLREAEMANGVRPGDVAVMPIIESARGVLRCEDIATASDRVAGLAVGAYDYTAGLGVARDRDGRALAHLRYVVVQVAVAYGLVPIDTPYADIEDEAGLTAETELVQAIGFKGKLVVHPRQIPLVNGIFAPAPDDVAQARRVVEAFDEGVSRGLGAVSLDGRMVDGPIAARARQLLAFADEIARREAEPR